MLNQIQREALGIYPKVSGFGKGVGKGGCNSNSFVSKEIRTTFCQLNSRSGGLSARRRLNTSFSGFKNVRKSRSGTELNRSSLTTLSGARMVQQADSGEPGRVFVPRNQLRTKQLELAENMKKIEKNHKNENFNKNQENERNLAGFEEELLSDSDCASRNFDDEDYDSYGSDLDEEDENDNEVSRFILLQSGCTDIDTVNNNHSKKAYGGCQGYTSRICQHGRQAEVFKPNFGNCFDNSLYLNRPLAGDNLKKVKAKPLKSLRKSKTLSGKDFLQILEEKENKDKKRRRGWRLWRKLKNRRKFKKRGFRSERNCGGDFGVDDEPNTGCQMI